MKKRIKAAFIIFLTMGTYAVHANRTDENMALARINSLLNAVYPLIDDAQKASNPNQRIVFRYDRLRSDIQAIQQGIAERINEKIYTPQNVPPLQTEFQTDQTRRQAS